MNSEIRLLVGWDEAGAYTSAQIERRLWWLVHEWKLKDVPKLGRHPTKTFADFCVSIRSAWISSSRVISTFFV
jgi:hypothetical protein